MTQVSDSYIKGFVETCFKEGVHEKQAAAMLDLVVDGIEKKAFNPSFGKGLVQIGSGIGNVLGGTAKGIGNLFSAGSVLGKPFSLYGKHVIAEPMKRLHAKGETGAALAHLLAAGGIPALGGTYAFQNFRDTDSSLAAAINDILGNPEFLVSGKSKGGTYVPPTSSGTSSLSASSYTPDDSPTNIPGTTTYTPGEKKLLGTDSNSSSSGVPEELLPAFNAAVEARKAVRNSSSNAADSVSASVRRNLGKDSGYEAELKERSRQADNTLRDLITDINKRRTSNNAALAAEQAARADELRQLRNRDAYQGRLAFDESAPGFAGWAGGVANRAMEGAHILDNAERARARESELINAQRAVDDINNRKAEGLLSEKSLFDKLTEASK